MFPKIFSRVNLKRVAGILGLANGGTGASTAAAARTNLGVYSTSEIDTLVSGLLDLRGSFDASGGGYPTTGGSGAAGAVVKGDTWKISVAGTIGQVGDVVFALVDTPGQTAGNWDIIEGNLTESSFGTFGDSLTGKTTPVDADSLVGVDSADSNKAKKFTFANLKLFFWADSVVRPKTVEESLSATRAIVRTEGQVFNFNPNGASRDVTLYASPTVGDTVKIRNSGNAGNVLTIKDSGNVAISGAVIPNGVTLVLTYYTGGWSI